MTKTIIATGTAGGIGFELVKQLIAERGRYRMILGVRNPTKSRPEFEALVEHAKDAITLLKCDLTDLKGVRTFAQQSIEALGSNKLDYVLLNAAHSDASKAPGPYGSKWNESYMVNHLSQHYLLHLLKDQIVKSHSRIVVVSSGVIREVKASGDVTPQTIRSINTAGSNAAFFPVYATTKFVQLLGALWWRRQLGSHATVVAVSPGLIKGTGIGRHSGMDIAQMPDAKTVSDGARSVFAAFERDDLPQDANDIMLTSWGEWWKSKEVYPLALDTKLQDGFCPSREEIEREESL